jgi:uncharacterized membrane protein YjjP (DUF1212 family)
MLADSRANVNLALSTELVKRYAVALHDAGSSAHRLEESVGRVVHALGMESDVLSTPAGVLICLDAGRTTLFLRRPPSRFNLARQTALYQFAEEVSADPVDAAPRLNAILKEAAPYSPRVRIIAYTVAGGVFSIFLGGGWREAVLGLATGLGSGLILHGSQYSHRMERMPEIYAAALATAVAGLLSLLLPCSDLISVLGGLLLLLPGMPFTVAIAEMANRAQLAGTIRLGTSAWSLVVMVFGAALGSALPRLFGNLSADVPPTPLPTWVSVACLPLAGLVLAVHIQARKAEIAWIVAACAVAFSTSRILHTFIAEDWLCIFVAALSVGLFGNLASRVRALPSAALTVAALYLLVPGSVGYRGVLAMASGDTLKGLELGLSMAMRGIALVAGLVFASLMAPPRAPSTRREGVTRSLWHSERL